jgi:O-antigen ligase
VVICTPTYGQSALGEARKDYLIFLFPILFLLTIKNITELCRFIRVVILIATGIAAVGLTRGLMAGSLVRVLGGSGTLILALAMFSMIVHRIYKITVLSPMLDKILIAVFSVMVIMSGQRSVWLGVGFGLLILVWLYHRRAAGVTKMVIFGVFSLFGLVVVLATFPEAGSKLAKQFSGIVDPSEDTTASWRMEGWRQQLSTLRGAKLIFGEGLGSYYSWRISGQTLKVAPHNIYVQLLLKFGLVGISIYLLWALKFFRKSMAVRKRLTPGPAKGYVEMGIVIFGASHAYMLGYGFEPIMLIFVAVALSAVGLSHIPHRATQYSQLGRHTVERLPDAPYPPGRPDPWPVVS